MNTILKNVPFSVYKQSTAINKHGLDDIARSPLHFVNARSQEKEPTPAMKWGSALHCKVLTPERFTEEFAVAEKVNKRTKEGKAYYDALEMQSSGKTIIDEAVYNEVSCAAELLTESMMTIALMFGLCDTEDPYTGTELTGFFRHELGADCKIRPDMICKINGKYVMIDLKTCRDARKSAFMRDCIKFRYFEQAAMYSDGFNIISGEDCEFIFIAIENKEPYGFKFYEVSKASIEKGSKSYTAAMKTYMECLRLNKWPGYSDEIEILDAPEYAFEDDDEDEDEFNTEI